MEPAFHGQYFKGRSSGHPQRSQSFTRTRPQSAPRAYSHNNYQRTTSGWPNQNSTLEPKLSRSRPQSAKSNLSYKSSSYGGTELDFTGLSNMMQGLRFKQSRKWKPKSTVDQNENNISDKNENLERCFHKRKVEIAVETKESDANILRKSRTSSYSKFKYPLKHHNIKDPNARLILEHSIPVCLRKVSRYINSPMRKNCAYNPPVRAVTNVNKHSLRSSSLPSPKCGKNYVTTKPPIAPPKQQTSSIDLENNNTPEYSNEDDDRERNGSYHYVYNGPPNEANCDIIVETPNRKYTGEDISTTQCIVSTPDLQVETNSQIQVNYSDHMIHQNSGINDDRSTHVIEDKGSGSDTDDLYADDDLAAQYDDILRNTCDAQLSSDEPIKDHSSENESPWKSTQQDVFEHYQNSSTEEIQSDIEEDIPEEIQGKTISFTSGRAVKK